VKLGFSIAACLLVAILALDDLLEREGTIFMRQPLSSKHSMMEKECVKCHDPWRGVNSMKCKGCHKQEMHMITTSKTHQKDCLECHSEHKGKTANLTVVSDEKCLECHQKEAEPPWAHSQKLKPGRSGVLLTHKTHFERGFAMENVCKTCHIPHTFRIRADISRPLKDIMYKHSTELKFRCPDCHEEVKSLGFSASGGALAPVKCTGCHEKRYVSVSCGYCHKFHNISLAEAMAGSLPPF